VNSIHFRPEQTVTLVHESVQKDQSATRCVVDRTRRSSRRGIWSPACAGQWLNCSGWQPRHSCTNHRAWTQADLVTNGNEWRIYNSVWFSHQWNISRYSNWKHVTRGCESSSSCDRVNMWMWKNVNNIFCWLGNLVDISHFLWNPSFLLFLRIVS